MEEFQTGAVRDTGGKGRMDLLPWAALIRVSKHMEDAIKPDPETGIPHYPERNWEKGIPIHSMVDSAFRHLAKYVDGWDDEDHLCAAATNLLMAMWMEVHHPDMQDIPTRPDFDKTINNGTSHGNVIRTKCDCYDNGRCNGTKERDECNCGGLYSLCEFRPEKRGTI